MDYTWLLIAAVVVASPTVASETGALSGLLAAQSGGWIDALPGDGEAAVLDAWIQPNDAAFAGLLPGYAFAQSVELNLTAAGSIAGTLELDGAQGIAVFESGGRTYAAVAAYTDNGVQILDITNPSDITATDNIGDTRTLKLSGTSGIAVFESGGRTYAAVAAYTDNGVQILDITNPYSITTTDNIGDTGTLELSGASGIAVFESGGRTYAAVAAYTDNGVQILDITNPYSITTTDSIGDTGTLELSGARDITTFTSGDNTYAAVAAFKDDGVQILDITNPYSITATDSIYDTEILNLDGATGITTFESGDNTYAAVAAGIDDGVQILDITNPYSITATDSIYDTETLNLDGADDIAVFKSGANTYAAVTAYNDDGVQILDITDPSAITATSSIDDISLELDGTWAITTFTSDGNTYAAITAFEDDGVQILDVTDPYDITAADGIDDTETIGLDGARGIATFTSGDNTYAAVAAFSGSVQILDITDPYFITATDSIYDTETIKLDGADGIAVFKSGDNTYAAVAAFSGSVQILDITDPYSITAADSITNAVVLLDGARGITTFTSGDITYAAVASIIDDGVQILDITDPYDITAAGRIDGTETLELDGALGITTFTSGGNTYAAVTAYNDDGVQILDVTDPSDITATSSIDGTETLELDGAQDITVFKSGDNTYAAVTAANDDGVQILDITDPYDITAAGSITDDLTLELDGARGITVFESGDRTYAAVAAYGNSGVQILDITDPYDITAAGSITDDATLELDGALGIATFTSGDDTYAAVTAYLDSGVQILRLTGDGQELAGSNTSPAAEPNELAQQPPTVTSIERYSPAVENTDSQTLVYEVTFSENVTGVDTTDFALSSDSTGGSSSTQFTQTRSPAIAITAANTITDTITVPDSGTVTSVSVAVDVSHTYKGDLKVDLIAPDGTTKTVHNRSGGSADDIDQTYTPNFAGVSITGIWTLRINDNYAAADDGTLNSWTLTINSGSSSSDTSNPVTSVSGSGDTYQVTVSAVQDGTYNLDLISSGHGIEDTAENPLTNTSSTGADETYTVSTVVADTTAPGLSSIEWFNPSSATTSSQTLVYEVIFSEDVTGVGTTDFALSSDSTGGTSTSSGTGQFTQTNSPDIDITEDNSTITDTITVADSGTVTSLSLAVDISHTYKGDLKVDLIAPDGTTKTVHNRSGGSADDIDQTYTPNFAGVSIAGTWTLKMNDNYPTADDGTLNSWTLTINHGSSSSSSSSSTVNPVTSLSGSGSTYYVTVSAVQDGTYNLDLISSGHGIADESSNPLTNTATTGADETYTVSTVVADTTAPRLSSIERFNPSTATTPSQTLVYEVTFSESVTGVTQSDFALSSDSTGGSSSAQFTQTRSPAIAITAANTITDTITVPDSGTVTSVSITIDVSHTYIGDLKIDLVAPDGTIKTVHNRSGGSADDIDQTYTPDFAGVSIAGTWTLKINDNYAAADDGTLNSWTLTINSGSSSSSSDTSNPVASVSGSGDTYQVTVSATQDGTYNLDLVSSGHDIEDESNNPLTDVIPTTGTDETYTVNTASTDTIEPADTTAPTLSSIERSSPATESADSQTLIYEVTFSEDVTGVDATDFAMSSDSTGGTGTSSGTGQFTQTNSPDIDITEDDSTITDTITVADSGTVTSLSLAVDISHTYKGDLKVDLVAPDGTTKTVHNRSGGSADDIDQTYTPNFAGVSIAGTWTLKMNDNYPTADDGTLNSWTLTINHGSSSSSSTVNPVTSLSGSGSTYYVTVSAVQDGTYNLDLISSGHGIADESSNPLTNTATTGADETYTVSTVVADTTAPRLSSIERFNPSTATTPSQTLVYEVTFSESVTGVTQSDFALSSDSTGGSSSAQFTQTRSPAIAITAANTITDTITVPDSGTVTSVSITIDVSHTYIGDLKIDLVAPDGTIKTVHNRSGGSADDIDQTYTPDFAGVSIAGTWTLKINDNYAAADDGTLNSWTLTINSGSSSSSSDTSNPVASVSGSGDTYQVTVSATQDGTYNLDLVSSGHDIEDESNNPLTDVIPTTGTDETYTVNTASTDTIEPADTTAPTLSSIERSSPATESADSQTLIYEVTFSEDVTGVDATDFAMSSDSTGGTGTSSGTGQFTQTNSPDIDITEDDSTITDTITVADSGTVTSLSLAVDISHTYKGDLKVDLVAPDGTTKTVHNRSGGSADDIDQTYTPNFAGVSIAGTWTLKMNDNYPTADDGTLNSWTLTINHGSSSITTNPVTSLSGSGSTYYVTVSAVQDGTYNLDLISSGHGIADESSNPLTNTATTGADETYTVSTVVADTTAPRLSSIERFNPSTATTPSQTLVYEVTFSESVTGVTQSDFALSSDSTGGSSSAQFTQTRSPAIAITAANTITDTITVPDSGTVTSVSITIDVSHTYIGDLKIDLVAPDGTIKTVHNRSGGSADDIDQTYTPDFAGVSIAGTWTLKINDNYAAADDGTLNSWTLTINSGSSSSSSDTSNPVASVSGSGDTYQVTVSATQDGTYNLDLVSSGHGITDESSNPLTDTTPTGEDHTYTVNTIPADTTAPHSSSKYIEEDMMPE